MNRTCPEGRPGPGRPGFIFHVPHASKALPPEIRERILLDDGDLNRELLALTDTGADRFFLPCQIQEDRTVLFPWSRLTVDVERFREDRDEPMAARGMGAVYTRTSEGRPIREPGFDRERMLADYYDPHHARLTAAVREALAEHGTAFILDCHTFPSRPLPCELDQEPDRPDVCIGTDGFHTPDWVVGSLEETFRRSGLRVAENRPYAGTMVPLEFLGRDRRVLSVMIEIRRGLFMEEGTGVYGNAFSIGFFIRGAIQMLRRYFWLKMS